MHVLLLIQDPAFREETRRILHGARHTCVTAFAPGDDFDMAVVDTDEVERLRAQVSDLPEDLPILALSDGRVEERVRALYSGADDCLDAPFAASQMAARVHAFERRVGRMVWQPRHGCIRVGELEIDLGCALATRGPTRYQLTAREIELIRYLHKRRPRAVPRAELLENVWHLSPNVKTRAVDVAVSSLRRKLENDPKEPRVIRSIVGVGYAWAS